MATRPTFPHLARALRRLADLTNPPEPPRPRVSVLARLKSTDHGRAPRRVVISAEMPTEIHVPHAGPDELEATLVGETLFHRVPEFGERVYRLAGRPVAVYEED